MFARFAKESGFSPRDFIFTPQIRCAHDADSYSTAEKRLIQKTCRGYLLETISKVKPEVIIPLGAEAARQVLGRVAKIGKIRGALTPLPEYDSKLFAMLNPGYVSMYPQHEPVFAADMRGLRRLIDSDYDMRAAAKGIRADYSYIDDLQFLIDAKPRLIAFDTETTGLSWFSHGEDVRELTPDSTPESVEGAVLTMQFCIEPGVAYTLVWDHPEQPRSRESKNKIKRQLIELLCSGAQIVGQNIKFDAVWIAAKLGVKIPISHDTEVIAHLLDENAMEKNLNILTKRYAPDIAGYDDDFNRTVDKSRMWAVPLEKLLHYSAGDADAVFRVFNAMYPILSRDKKLLLHYERIDIPALNTFVSFELRGLHVDLRALEAFETQMAETVESQRVELLRQIPRSIKKAHADKGVSFSRQEFLRDVLFHHPDGFRLKPKVWTATTMNLDVDRRIPSTSSKDHLPYFFDECPFTERLAQHIKDTRLLGTNIRRFRENYIHDNKVRPRYSITRTVTGRSSSEAPNGQNYPSRGPLASAYKRMFVAPPGYVFVAIDLSQAELRIAGDMARDPAMIDIYKNDGDIHTKTACIVAGITQQQFDALPRHVQKDYRSKAKSVNFGFLFGLGWKNFIKYAYTNYGAVFTDAEAKSVREAFFATYSKLPVWHESMRNTALRNKFTRSYTGRVRHLPMVDSPDESVRQEALRQAINSGVQNTASDLGLLSMARIEDEIDPKYMELVSFIHDAIYAYVPEEYAAWGCATLKWYMETNDLTQFGTKMVIPIRADVSIGRNMGDLVELGGFSYETPYDYDWAGLDKEGGIQLCEQLEPPGQGRRTTPRYGHKARKAPVPRET